MSSNGRMEGQGVDTQHKARRFLLTAWLTDEAADLACECYGLYRVTDFICDHTVTPYAYKVRPEIALTHLRDLDSPKLFPF